MIGVPRALLDWTMQRISTLLELATSPRSTTSSTYGLTLAVAVIGPVGTSDLAAAAEREPDLEFFLGSPHAKRQTSTVIPPRIWSCRLVNGGREGRCAVELIGRWGAPV